jgi:hypothetical protein
MHHVLCFSIDDEGGSMNKKLSDHVNVGSDRDSGKKINDKQRAGNKGSTQSGDDSNVSKKVSNIHRQ